MLDLTPRDLLTKDDGPLPSWVTEFRPHQVEAYHEIMDEYASGKKLVLLDAPTGSGKTLLAEMVRRGLDMSASYICSTKGLQDQFLADFPYAQVLKGRSNYIPYDTGMYEDVTCADCTRAHGEECMWCPVASMCPYEVAKKKALSARLSVLNTSYLLAEANYAGKFSNRQFTIVDECDSLEGEILGFVEVGLSERRRKDLGIGLPDKVTKPESWALWLARECLPAVGRAIDDAQRWRQPSIQQIRRLTGLRRLQADLRTVAPQLTSGNWVFDGYKRGACVFKPIRVNEYGEGYLWRHSDKWMLMSATIISPQELVDSLGWEGEYGVVTVPMTFAKARRPIHVAPVARVTKKEEDNARPVIATAVGSIIDRHPTERILVHTVSYALATYLHESDAVRDAAGDRPVLTYRNAMERENGLAEFRATEASIMLAPSLGRGVNLPGDECGVIVVAKIPYLNLGDKQVNARLYSRGGGIWYQVQAVRSLVQSTGRGMRSAEDECVTYLLDAQFGEVWTKNKMLLPKWWTEALDFTFNKRVLLES